MSWDKRQQRKGQSDKYIRCWQFQLCISCVYRWYTRCKLTAILGQTLHTLHSQGTRHIIKRQLSAWSGRRGARSEERGAWCQRLPPRLFQICWHRQTTESYYAYLKYLIKHELCGKTVSNCFPPTGLKSYKQIYFTAVEPLYLSSLEFLGFKHCISSHIPAVVHTKGMISVERW